MATTRLHNHAVFQIKWNNSRQVIFYLLPRVTWTNDFLNQQAMFTAMKSRAHFLISNYVRWGNPSDDKSLIIVLFVSDHRQEESLEKRTKEKSGKFGDTYYCYLWVVAELRRMGSGRGCEIFGPSSYGIMSILHTFFSFCLVSKTFLETRLPRPEFVQNQTSNHQIIPTVWSIRNVNICWWWSCYNSSCGCCVKLFCWSLISVITG